MKAFHGKEEVKEKYLNRVKAHASADEFIQGTYWENGKGCAVGCTVHSDNHNAYEDELGIPAWLAKVEDRIFEGLPLDKAKKWPGEFLSSIKVGADLNKIEVPFLIFVVESTLDKFDHDKFPKVKSSIDGVLKVLREDPENKDALDAAAYAADAAADAAAGAAAAYAAHAAARTAYAAHAYAAAADAAAAAYAAARAAADADVAYAADAAAAAAYEKFAAKLIELFKGMEE